VRACAQEEVEYLAAEARGAGGIRGMGAPAPEVVAADVEQQLRQEALRLLGDERLAMRFVELTQGGA
jgi:3-deoxy-D-arabino-heptulosonate 7-phosphate (DAHP) synthase